MSELRRLLPTMPKMGLLLIFLPIAIYMEISGIHGVPTFVASALGILGTVTLIGKATEEVAIYSGPLWGGLLNATFGNITELIIALLALSKGPELYPIVPSSCCCSTCSALSFHFELIASCSCRT
jgi:calcium/proton exchanger cax